MLIINMFLCDGYVIEGCSVFKMVCNGYVTRSLFLKINALIIIVFLCNGYLIESSKFLFDWKHFFT